MGLSIASSSLTFILFTLLLLLPLCSTTVAYAAAEQAYDTRETPPPPPLLPPPPPPPPPEKPSSAFKPGMAVVVGVLTTMFSLTFLLLLYIKHCNTTTADSTATASYQTSRAAPFSGRKNSGIDRSIVESLPIFRFGSLRGHKDGLDCAVCLNKFESSEVLRLLPKCKHAFHVECVDTWLDAHSTCPLCRHRVDPEDILLVEDTKLVVPLHQHHQNNKNDGEEQKESCSERNSFVLETRRVSGRHSSVGEKEGGFLEIILEDEAERRNGASFRRSLDSATCTSSSTSRSTSRLKKKENAKGVTGWLVRPRKDGMLLATQQQQQEAERERGLVERRVEHRIIVSPSTKQHCGLHRDQRWSDVQPSDLLYLTSEMIISGGGGIEDSWVINTRSVSEITGLSRFLRNKGGGEQGQGREREEGVVSRWLAWISRSQTQPAVR